jgi:hypothetical protein
VGNSVVILLSDKLCKLVHRQGKDDGDEDLMNRIDELPNDKIMSAKSCVLEMLEMACSSFNES